ncbi:hypothetical protein GGS23DRAFT_207078 [Durotheca rogersii]|uniref:uncharacterized protein n=1 Tax=Durotheca rogersii TaxID=419775 RepID=UPI00221F6DDE|nr:uncharacterized protein GGS23DRAFT_207078 [Durotheca rogersii]KAI5861056.1 hypothetical protein GGS23DRAFT_207078 [Durotheca rogersii]
MSSHEGTTTSTANAATANPGPANPNTISRVTTSGVVATTTDPTAAPTASTAEKLRGDAVGAARGVAGSLQAVVGETIRNHDLAAKGFAKMREEDERLGVERGVLPVGAERRREVGAGEATGAGSGASARKHDE